jgi:hypothetical protein
MSLPRREPTLSRRDLVLALTEARIIADKTMDADPSYLAGYHDATRIAMELIRALDAMERAIDARHVERR